MSDLDILIGVAKGRARTEALRDLEMDENWNSESQQLQSDLSKYVESETVETKCLNGSVVEVSVTVSFKLRADADVSGVFTPRKLAKRVCVLSIQTTDITKTHNTRRSRKV